MPQRRRLGFATNSSSSHSIVLLKEPVADRLMNDALQYGWETFILSSSDEKAKYFLTAYLTQVGCFDSYQQEIVRKWLGLSRSEISKIIPKFVEKDFWIDHESNVVFPKEYGHFWNNLPDFDYLMAIKKEIIDNPNIAILGGNDNCDPEDHIEFDTSLQVVSEGGRLNAHPILKGVTLDGYPTWVIRKDRNHWVKFNYETGEKIHFGDSGEITKADTPELVDIKITERCNHMCKFCYQDSTYIGKDVSEDSIRNIITALTKLKVFEVALGGGDPLLVPELPSILKHFREAGIVPNFSTRSYLELISHPKFIDIIDTCGSIGISVTDAHELEQSYARLIVKFMDSPTPKTSKVYNGGGLNYAHQVIKNKFVYHIIPGVISSYQLENIFKMMEFFPFKVLLLGPKFVGRGTKLDKKRTMEELTRSKKDIMFAIKEYRGRVSLDTSLAFILEKELHSINADPRTYFIEEGKFSMYIDAVKGTCAPSSFSDKVTNLPKMSKGYPRQGEMDNYIDEIRRTFASY